MFAAKGNATVINETAEGQSNFILEELAVVLKHIEQSTMGTEREDDFGNLFEDLDLNSTKLMKTVKEKNAVISKVLGLLDGIDFRLPEVDVLVDD